MVWFPSRFSRRHRATQQHAQNKYRNIYIHIVMLWFPSGFPRRHGATQQCAYIKYRNTYIHIVIVWFPSGFHRRHRATQQCAYIKYRNIYMQMIIVWFPTGFLCQAPCKTAACVDKMQKYMYTQQLKHTPNNCKYAGNDMKIGTSEFEHEQFPCDAPCCGVATISMLL